MDVFLYGMTDRLILLICGLLMSAMFFGPLKLYQSLGLEAPSRLMVRIVRKVVKKLNREKRSTGTRVYRGIILLLFFVGSAGMAGYLLHRATLSLVWLQLLEMWLIAYLIPVRHLRDEAAEVGRAVKRNQMDRARSLMKYLARREFQQLDAHGMRRVAIEYLAENWCDKIISPAIWYLLLGLPGLFMLRMINLLDHLIGHRSKEFIAFGWAAAKLDDLLMLIPARIGGLYFVLASLFIPKGKPLAAIQTIWKQSGATASPNSGWPLAAMAGALHISLCGPRKQADAVIQDAWIGKGSAKVTQTDFRRALALYLVALILLLLSCLLLLTFLSGTEFSAISRLAELA